MKTLSVGSLRFSLLNIGYITDAKGREEKVAEENYPVNARTRRLIGIINGFLRDYGDAIKYVNQREEIYNITHDYIAGKNRDATKPPIIGLHARIKLKFSLSDDFGKLIGLVFGNGYKRLGIRTSVRYSGPAFQIINLRLVSRVGPDGNQINEVLFTILQKCGVIFKNGEFLKTYVPKPSYNPKYPDKPPPPRPEGGFEFMGGCTLIFDLDSQRLKYAILKPLIDMDIFEATGKLTINQKRIETQYKMQFGTEEFPFNDFALYFGNSKQKITEPFAFLHQT
jgi:hypothetical protein